MIDKKMNERLSQHFVLGELCKTSVKIENVPNEVQVENLKRLCRWLERLRKRYNERYEGLTRRGQSPSAPQAAHSWDSSLLESVALQSRVSNQIRNEELEIRNEIPIIINSGFRSAAVNRAVGGSPTSNHLTGCAVDIRCAGIEQALRYATILLDISDESREEFDELLIEKKASVYWIHFAVRPKDNRRRVRMVLV